MGRTDRKTTKEHVPPCKTALVTGGAGFIGANLITELIKQNYTVYSLDNYSTGSEDNHIDGEGLIMLSGTSHNFYTALNQLMLYFI